MKPLQIILICLTNAIFINGLITNDREFEDTKNNIKFNDQNGISDVIKNPEGNYRKTVIFTEDSIKKDKVIFKIDSDANFENNKSNNLIIFEDKLRGENTEIQNTNENNNFVKRPRRRKRRPKQQPVNGNYVFVNQGFSQVPHNFGLDRPPHRIRLPRKPSLTEQATAIFINTLTSISLYDDQQCIPKLLCETTAGRKGGFSGASMLNGFIDLQPLMTLLLAYNGATASPLFSFARAVIIGMSSSPYNPYICRKSYPLCPSDPDRLVHYLNNHNGGFFRFFNNPNNHQEQSLNQFLGHLSNAPPGYGQNLNVPHNFNELGYPQNQFLMGNQQIYNSYGQLHNQNGYGFYKSKNRVSEISLKNLKDDFGKELIENESQIKFHTESKKNGQELTKDDVFLLNISSTNTQNSNLRDSTKITRRILTKSDHDDEEDDAPIEAFEDTPKWFSTDNNQNIKTQSNNKRKVKTLLFPDEIDVVSNSIVKLHQTNAEYKPPPDFNNDYNNRGIGFVFPDKNGYYNAQDNTHRFKTNKYNKLNVKYENNKVKNDEYETVYVVRGNGDPYYPEIVKIRTGTHL